MTNNERGQGNEPRLTVKYLEARSSEVLGFLLVRLLLLFFRLPEVVSTSGEGSWCGR